MKTHRIGILVVPLLLAGCAYGKVVMKIDPSLESNALVYEVKNQKSLSNRNLSFGPYRVEGAYKDVTKRTISSKTSIAWLNVLFGRDQPVEKIEETVWSYSYKFIVGGDIAWDADGNALVTVVPSAGGGIGAVKQMVGCTGPFDFDLGF